MTKELPKQYAPEETERAIYALWEKSGFFNPDVCIEKGITRPDAEKFSIVLPPPNVTGTLHMGHAAMVVIEDILVRYARMNGKRTLWVPGTDSAAIATQSKVENIIYKKEKKTRYDLGREELLRRVTAFAEESKNTILGQIRAMGASLDWTRYAYTLDEKRSRAVTEAFVRMYDAGLIYRGDRIVNWDPNMQTTVSDDEIEWKEESRPFYYLKYGPFTIGTARPETKFGDKYVVMHPDDQRYARYKDGDTFEAEWINGPITATVVKDAAIDMDFGSGAMTITPWHDAADFEIAERHGLSREQIIDEKGKLLPIAGEFAGQHIKKARAAIVEKLKAKGLIERIDEKYVGRIATNSRGGGIIEPQIKRQWFVGVTKPFVISHSTIAGIKTGDTITLKRLMRHVVETGQIKIMPGRFEKIYYHWIDNLRDWCISRQIWFGHRIPVWYKNTSKNKDQKAKSEEGEIYCGREAPQGDGWEQDPDTLDTWFASGLWTFSALGWPDTSKTAIIGQPGPENDFANYHPTSLIETGYDIIFFWVARIILMGGCLLGDVPFRTVYLHGLVRDAKGRKMSKSLGNIIDPVDMIKKYGTDATRMSLVVGNAPGNDTNLSEDKIRGYKHFANKIWNIARFVFSYEEYAKDVSQEISTADAAYRAELTDLATDVTADIEGYRLHLAAEKLYHYAWHRFADVIIEESKPILTGTDPSARAARAHTLLNMFDELLRLLHPFMPFVTEELYRKMSDGEKILMVEPWPRGASSDDT